MKALYLSCLVPPGDDILIEGLFHVVRYRKSITDSFSLYLAIKALRNQFGDDLAGCAEAFGEKEVWF